MLMSELYLILIVSMWPFEFRQKNMLEVFNEVQFLIMCYPILQFTDYAQDLTIQYNMGWIVVGQLGWMTVFNIIYICIDMRKGYYAGKHKDALVALRAKMIKDREKFHIALNQRSISSKVDDEPLQIPSFFGPTETKYY